jgi:molecular chaperone GrpE
MESIPPPDEPREESPATGEEATISRDRYLRLAADFENFKRRSTEETERRAAAQKEDFIRDLLPIIDNFERALAVEPDSEDPFRIGIEMTLRQLDQLLLNHRCEPEDKPGVPFDPARHEAVGSRCDLSQADHVVLEVVQRGWRRMERLLRPARVVINDHAASPPAASQPPQLEQ